MVVQRQNHQQLAKAIARFIETKERDEDLDTRSRIVANFSIDQLTLNSTAKQLF